MKRTKKQNIHFHLHFLLIEGVEDQKKQFHKLSIFDEGLIAKFFSGEVFFHVTARRTHQFGIRAKDPEHLSIRTNTYQGATYANSSHSWAA